MSDDGGNDPDAGWRAGSSEAAREYHANRQHRAQNHDQRPRHVDVRGDRFDEIPCNWDTMSIDALWRLFNERRPTPQSVIEALIWTVRERGPKALSEPTNLERLRRCDEAALVQINARIGKLKRAGR